MKKISRKELIVLAVILIGFSVFALSGTLFRHGPGARHAASRQYYCPMHPTYVSDRPGDCPICSMKLVPLTPTLSPLGGEGRVRGKHKILYYRHPMGQPDTSPVPKKDSMGMDYVPVYEDEIAGRPSQVAGHASVQIPMEKQQLIGVKLGTVEKRKLTKEIRTTGRVAYDPELFTAQQEFLSAVSALKKARGGPYPELLERSEELVRSARTRLRLLGMSDAEVKELEGKATQDKNLILPERFEGPFSSARQSVWVYAAVYEYELPFVKMGTPVKVRVPTFADREFAGEVRALDPVLDSGTRSIRVRARVSDPEGLLKPEMYVDVYLKGEVGAGLPRPQGEETSPLQQEVLVVPEEAVMQTGERAIVFATKGDGFFEPREVKLGTKAGNFYEVKAGLEAGEQIAVSGNFLIDSESRLQSALQGMSSESESAGHVHGQ